MSIAALPWMFPIVAGAMVGLVAWLLLFDVDRSRSFDCPSATKCSSCDSQVFDDWRLCPYCGKFVDEPAEVELSESVPV